MGFVGNVDIGMEYSNSLESGVVSELSEAVTSESRSLWLLGVIAVEVGWLKDRAVWVVGLLNGRLEVLFVGESVEEVG